MKNKQKWYYWDVFNQCWMWNGEGVKNWRKQGFTVKKLPILFTLLFLSSFAAVFGQGKPAKNTRYWKVDIEYYTISGCHVSVTDWAWGTNGSPTLDHFFNYQKKWVSPQKIDEKTYFITGIKQVPYSEFKLHKPEKYKPCIKYEPFNLSIIDTGTDLLKFHFAPTTWKVADYVWYGISGRVMTISSPDSNKIITVKFSRSKVHFINDSTFTIKQ